MGRRWEGDLRRREHVYTYGSVQFNRSVVSDSLWPHGLQHARHLCPSPMPRACSNSCWLSQGCHLTISSSVVPFCLQSFPASGSFPVSQFFASGGQSIGVSASVSVLSMNIQDWNQDWLVWSPCSPRHSEESFPTLQFKSINSSALSCHYSPTLTSIYDYWKNHKSHEGVQILWFSFHKDKKTQDSRLPLVLVKELHVPTGYAGVPHWGLSPKPQRRNAHFFIHSLRSSYLESGTEGKSDEVLCAYGSIGKTKLNDNTNTYIATKYAKCCEREGKQAMRV